MKLKLECSSEIEGNEKYIVSRTFLENTSRRPIYLMHAFILIVNQSVPLEEYTISYIISGLSKKKYRESIPDEATEFQSHVAQVLGTNDFVVKLLPYYYVSHERLGSLAHMNTTHIQRMNHGEIYSIYFSVVGRDWYKGAWVNRKRQNYNPSQARFVHDEVLVR